MKTKTYLSILAVCAVATLAGCGGGSEGGTPPTGSWYVSGSSSTNNYAAIQIVVLLDGTTWGLYGFNATSAGIQGMLHGSAPRYYYDCLDYTDPDDDTSDCLDYSYPYVHHKGTFTQFDMSGSVSNNTTTHSFTLAPDSGNISIDNSAAFMLFSDDNGYQFILPPNIEGTYSGWTAVSGQARHNLANITISGSTLSLPPDDTGCSATGVLRSRSGDRYFMNSAYDVNLTFSGAGCALGDGAQLAGMVLPPNSTTGFNQLEVMTVTSDKKNAFLLVANPQ